MNKQRNSRVRCKLQAIDTNDRQYPRKLRSNS